MQNHSILSEEEWTVAINNCLGNTAKFQVSDVNTGPLADQLSGYVGDHIRVQVTITFEGKLPKERILKLFVKRIPLEDITKAEFILSTGSFPKETAFYSMMVEHLRRYLVKDQLPWAPECYFIRSDILVMEDLLDKEFTLFDKLQFMDYNHCRVLLQTIATFHASSIVLEEREGELSRKECKLNEIYPDLLEENLFVNSGENQFQYWFLARSKAMIALLPHLPNYGINSKFHDKVIEKVSGILDSMFDLMKPSTKYRNVLCHGDVWTNNMLFRYGDNKKTPVEMRFVDFQMYRYTPPAVDVMAAFFMTTSGAFRKQHEEDLLQVYYESLSRELLRNGYVAEQLLPWEEFRESCRYYAITGRINAAITFTVGKLPKFVVNQIIDSLTDQDNILIQVREKEVVHTFNTNQEYRLIMIDILEEMIECDILKR